MNVSLRIVLLVSIACGMHAKSSMVDLAGFLAQHLHPRGYPKMFFSADTDLSRLLISMIDAETYCIHAAVFQLTSGDVAEALINARNRGVKVEIVFDGHGVNDSSSKFKALKKGGVKVYSYSPGTATLMHLKLFLFGKNFDGNPYAFTGSVNPTIAGLKRNIENAILLSDGVTLMKCHKEIERLKNIALSANN